MKVLVIFTFDIPEPEDIPVLLETIHPPSLPWFAGQVRIVVEPNATQLEKWLDA